MKMMIKQEITLKKKRSPLTKEINKLEMEYRVALQSKYFMINLQKIPQNKQKRVNKMILWINWKMKSWMSTL
jgi:hypothetical protein